MCAACIHERRMHAYLPTWVVRTCLGRGHGEAVRTLVQGRGHAAPVGSACLGSGRGRPEMRGLWTVAPGDAGPAGMVVPRTLAAHRGVLGRRSSACQASSLVTQEGIGIRMTDQEMRFPVESMSSYWIPTLPRMVLRDPPSMGSKMHAHSQK
eukprot:gene13435-biopygen8226